MVEKYAVEVGGGKNHRLGLDDGVLIKDNHIAIAGGVAAAVRAARETAGHLLKVEIEVETLAELRDALASGADAVLLDNMAPEAVREAVMLIRSAPGGSTIVVEASGRITLENVRAYAETGVDLISVGALAHSARAADIGLDFGLPRAHDACGADASEDTHS